MPRWNVVITVSGEGFRPAWRLLRRLGEVACTGFLNVLVLKVAEREAFLAALKEALAAEPEAGRWSLRAIPVTRGFDFQDPEEFAEKAAAAVVELGSGLGGKRFYVRVHRRGFRGKISASVSERTLGTRLQGSLESSGSPAEVSFDDPDAVVMVEMVGTRAGVGLVTREERDSYPFLRAS